MLFRNRYEDVLFDAGDRLLLTFVDVDTNEESFIEWTVPASYNFTIEYAEQRLSDGWVREANGDITFDYASDYGMGLVFGGHENIFPDKVRVLADGEVGIDLTGLTLVEVGDLTVGDRIVIGDWKDEYFGEFTLGEYHIEELEDEGGQLWESPINIPVELTSDPTANTLVGIRKQ